MASPSSDGEASLPQSATMNLWRETVSASISYLAAFGVGFLVAIVLTRYLPPSEVGLYFFLLAAVFLIAEVPKGFGRAVRKRASETSNRTRQSAFLWTASTLSLLYIAVASAAAWAAVPALTATDIEVLTSLNGTLISAVGLAAAGRSVCKVTTYYLSGCGHPGLANWLRGPFNKSIATVLMVVVLHLGIGGLSALFLCLAIGNILAAIVSLAASPPSFSRAALPTREDVRSLSVFAKWAIPNMVLNDFYHRFDTFVLGLFVGAVSVSYYDSSVRMAAFAFAVAAGVASAASVKVSGYASTGRDVEPIIAKATGVTALTAFPFLTAIVLLGEDLLTGFYGSEYTLAYYFLVGITAQQVLQSYRQTFEGVFEGLDTPRYNLYSSLVAVGVNVVTAVPFVLEFGGLGVVLSSLVADVARLGAFEHFIKQELGDYIRPQLLGAQLAAVGATLAVLYPLASTTGRLSATTAVIGVAATLVVYAAVFLVLSTRARCLLAARLKSV